MARHNTLYLLGRTAFLLSLLAAAVTLYLALTTSNGDRYTFLVTSMLWVSVGVLSYIIATIESRGTGVQGG